MQFANQTTFLPTNKLLTLHIVAILMYQFGMDFAPLPPEIVESYRFIISWTVGAAVSYLVPDFANAPRGGSTDAEEV